MTEDLRRNNLAALVRHLHLGGPLTRSELTALTGLNRSTVGDLVGALASVGLVHEQPPSSPAGAGRPSLVVSLSSERVWVLAAEIAAEAVVVARVGPGGQLRERLAEPRDWRAGLPPALAASTIARLARQLTRRAPAGATMVGAAVAVPGIVRRADGFVHLAPNLAWHNVPFGSLLSSLFREPAGHQAAGHTGDHEPGWHEPGWHEPGWHDRAGGDWPDVQVANEADLGALAECARGAAVGARDVIYVSGNAGVGAGVVIGGALLAGRSGYAGEVGHMKVNPDGHRCRCGGRGCWESEIGAAAVLRRAGRRPTGSRAGVARVLSDAQAGDATAQDALEETGRWIGRGAANLVNIFNPDLLVFGGTLRSVFLAAQPSVMTELSHQVLPQAGADATVVASGLGTDSALVGAAELAFSNFLADPVASASTNAENVV